MRTDRDGLYRSGERGKTKTMIVRQSRRYMHSRNRQLAGKDQSREESKHVSFAAASLSGSKKKKKSVFRSTVKK